MAFDLRRAALALGVGDMRVFLKQELANAFADELASTRESTRGPAPCGHARSEIERAIPRQKKHFARVGSQPDFGDGE